MTLGLKLENPMQEIPFINEGFLLVVPKSWPNVPKSFNFDVIEFSMTKLFNIQYLLHHKSKHYKAT